MPIYTRTQSTNLSNNLKNKIFIKFEYYDELFEIKHTLFLQKGVTIQQRFYSIETSHGRLTVPSARPSHAHLGGTERAFDLNQKLISFGRPSLHATVVNSEGTAPTFLTRYNQYNAPSNYFSMYKR